MRRSALALLLICALAPDAHAQSRRIYQVGDETFAGILAGTPKPDRRCTAFFEEPDVVFVSDGAPQLFAKSGVAFPVGGSVTLIRHEHVFLGWDLDPEDMEIKPKWAWSCFRQAGTIATGFDHNTFTFYLTWTPTEAELVDDNMYFGHPPGTPLFPFVSTFPEFYPVDWTGF